MAMRPAVFFAVSLALAVALARTPAEYSDATNAQVAAHPHDAEHRRVANESAATKSTDGGMGFYYTSPSRRQSFYICTCAKCGSTSLMSAVHEAVMGRKFVPQPKPPWIHEWRHWGPPSGRFLTRDHPLRMGASTVSLWVTRDPVDRYFSSFHSKIKCCEPAPASAANGFFGGRTPCMHDQGDAALVLRRTLRAAYPETLERAAEDLPGGAAATATATTPANATWVERQRLRVEMARRAAGPGAAGLGALALKVPPFVAWDPPPCLALGELGSVLERAHAVGRRRELDVHVLPQDEACVSKLPAKSLVLSGDVSIITTALRGLLGFGLHPVSEWHEHRSGRGGFDPTKEDIATMCTVAAPEYAAMKQPLPDRCAWALDGKDPFGESGGGGRRGVSRGDRDDDGGREGEDGASSVRHARVAPRLVTASQRSAVADLRPGRFAGRHKGKGPGDEDAGAQAGPAAGTATGQEAANAAEAAGSGRSSFSGVVDSAQVAHRAPVLSSLSARLESLGLTDWHGKTVKRPGS